MPYNPGGIFSLVASYFANPGTTIRTEQHNPPLEDIASALSSVLIRDGRAPMTGPLNMNGFAINNVVAGNTPSSVATLSQAMPIGAILDFAGSTAPAGWMLCYGQNVSRTTYAALFAIIGTTYGNGDGSTTFGLPDLRGRTTAGRDDMGGPTAQRLTPGYFNASPTALGAGGGLQWHQITQAELPVTNLSFTGQGAVITVQTTVNNVPYNAIGGAPFPLAAGGGRGFANDPNYGFVTSQGSYTPQGSISQFGANSLMSIVQPTMITNKIIRVSYDG